MESSLGSSNVRRSQPAEKSLVGWKGWLQKKNGKSQVDMSNISLFTGIHTNQMVVWGFFHQLYFSDGKIRRFKVLFQGQNWLSEVKFQELLLMKRSNKLILHTWKPWFLVKSCCGVRYGQMCVCVCVCWSWLKSTGNPHQKKSSEKCCVFRG